MPTDAGDICYQNSADKQTVNDISPACLSACGDNKQGHEFSSTNYHTKWPMQHVGYNLRRVFSCRQQSSSPVHDILLSLTDRQIMYNKRDNIATILNKLSKLPLLQHITVYTGQCIFTNSPDKNIYLGATKSLFWKQARNVVIRQSPVRHVSRYIKCNDKIVFPRKIIWQTGTDWDLADMYRVTFEMFCFIL